MVTDFGIARLAEAAPLTATGQVLGTVYYLSPEQVSGDPVDARSDIYSLGVVGYFALSGRFPFDAELASAVLIAHVNKSPPPLHTRGAVRAARACRHRSIAAWRRIRRRAFRSAMSWQRGCRRSKARSNARRRRERTTACSRRRTPLISDTEAQSIVGRAADLQAMTGVQPRTPTIPGTSRFADATRRERQRPPRGQRSRRGGRSRHRGEVRRSRDGRARTQTTSLPGGADRSFAVGRILRGSPTRLEYGGRRRRRDAGERLRSSRRSHSASDGRVGTDRDGRPLVLVAERSAQRQPSRLGTASRRKDAHSRFRNRCASPRPASSAASWAEFGGGSLPVWIGIGDEAWRDFGARRDGVGRDDRALLPRGARTVRAMHSRRRADRKSAKALIERFGGASARVDRLWRQPKLGAGLNRQLASSGRFRNSSSA